jgi:hypothetical protein
MKEEYKDLQKHGGINIKDFTPEKGYLPIVDLEEKDADLKTVKKFSDFGFDPSENLKFHLENKLSVLDNVFRPGSEAFFSLIKEAKKFTNLLSENDKQIFENSDLGEFAMFEGQMVPLDLPMENAETILEAKYKGKEVDLNKPMRSSGPKKYKVYVRNPKTGNVKVVNFGDVKGGLTAKVSDPKARKAFSSRMDCPSKKDKTKAGYWSCRLNKFGHLFGGSTYPGFW